MRWMSEKLSDNFQIREHSWPCLFHIILQSVVTSDVYTQKLDNIHLSSDVIFPVTTVLSASCEPLVSLSVRSKQDAIRVRVNIVFFAYNVTYKPCLIFFIILHILTCNNELRSMIKTQENSLNERNRWNKTVYIRNFT